MGNGKEMHVYPQALKRSKTGFEDGAATLKGIFERLGTRLSAEGKCWGPDKTGQAFEKDYLPAATEMQKAGPKASEAVGGVAKGIDKMAKNYTTAEDGSTI
ncbi:hypothetical protein [Thermomonospora umbrina]|uniref:WXG100 family type VII secretion target n=1 Tax=Thermomonospora umbrina TaxID=111806 RepID=A0A3D9SRI7_9ACTN|nr:hypothetical protein [Thermomonospora umbrina]REE96573.1 hypothetical protein DFJ69_2011 [Thermomonospora umbrina]